MLINREVNDKWNNAQILEKSATLDTGLTADYYLSCYRKFINTFPFRKLMKNITKEMRLLDIGSGPISSFEVLPIDCKEMVAIDPLNDSYASKFNRSTKVSYVSCLFEDFSIENDDFDLIISINALDHMLSIENTFEKISNGLKNNGYLFLYYENTTPITSFLERWGYKDRLSQYHIHKLEFCSIDKFLKERGFICVGKKLWPILGFRKILYSLKRILGFSKESSASELESRISILSQKKKSKIFLDILIYIVESLFYLVCPSRFCFIVESLYKKI